jgi:PAS domain S-box-containing protein
MNKRYTTLATTIIRNMYQVLFDVNTTILLMDKDCRVVNIWSNVSASQEFILDVNVGDDLSEEWAGENAFQQALKTNQFVELRTGIEVLNKSENMYNMAAPVHNAYDEIIGCLGVIGPITDVNMNIIRGTLKISIAALEGQGKAGEFKADYDRVYNQLLGSMETIPLGTIVTDNTMTILHVNDATQKIFGEQSKDIVGKRVDEYLNTGNLFQKMRDEGRTLFDEEMTFEMPDGKISCEVIVSLVKGEENESVQGLIIKLKNAEYMSKFKKSKGDKIAYFQFDDVIGNSGKLQEAIRLGKIAARSTSNVLILGESGTGKELFAQSIHNHSARREGPFVAINCGAMPSGLIESELFGYEGGAFTGARKDGQPGKFEQANGGTLFLDEIGDMPLNVQVSLLRVLQNKEVVRVGGNSIIRTNVRVIAATNHDIEKEVQENRFRKDLFYRINVFSIRIPSLNERIEDILPLSELFLKRYSVMLNKYITGIDPIAKQALISHNWSGNIRELENVIERAVNVTRGNEIGVEDLPTNFKVLIPGEDIEEEQNLRKITLVQEMEKMAIVEGLKKCKGNISKTADMIGMGRRSLYRRLKVYGIDNLTYKTK